MNVELPPETGALFLYLELLYNIHKIVEAIDGSTGRIKMNSKEKSVGAIIEKAYLDNMKYLGSIYIDAQRTIGELEGEAFTEAWDEMKRPFFLKCAEDAIKVASSCTPNTSARAQQVMANPELAGYPDMTHYMYPNYLFMLCYFIVYGKKGKAAPADQIDELCRYTMNTWYRVWGTDYAAGRDLYMGKTSEPLALNK